MSTLRELIGEAKAQQLRDLALEEAKKRQQELRELRERGADLRKPGPLKVWIDPERQVPGKKVDRRFRKKKKGW